MCYTFLHFQPEIENMDQYEVGHFNCIFLDIQNVCLNVSSWLFSPLMLKKKVQKKRQVLCLTKHLCFYQKLFLCLEGLAPFLS